LKESITVNIVTIGSPMTILKCSPPTNDHPVMHIQSYHKGFIHRVTTYIGFVIESMQNSKYSDNTKPDGIFKKVHHQQRSPCIVYTGCIHRVTTYIRFVIERMQNGKYSDNRKPGGKFKIFNTNK